jgi:hypothetical protein
VAIPNSGYLAMFICMSLAVACSKGPAQPDPSTCGPGPADASCRHGEQCYDIECPRLTKSGVCVTDQNRHKELEGCRKLGGVWSLGCPCSRDKSIGACRKVDDEERIVTTWIYGGVMTTEEYRSVCEMSVYNRFIEP